MRLVVVGIPRSRRIELLGTALRRVSDAEMVLVPWVELIQGSADLRSIVRAGDVLRIDSPGKDFATEKAVLAHGLGVSPAHLRPGPQQHVRDAHATEIAQLIEDRGRILWPAIWYRGFCDALQRIEQQLRECPAHRRMGDPADIRIMFDKTATHARLKSAGVPVPPAIGRIESFDDLLLQMSQRRWSRVFVKLAHGSSASGAIALRTHGEKMQAFTTVEFDGTDSNGEACLYNTRRIRVLQSPREIAQVVNAVCRHTAHAERWLPKAGIAGRTFDLRVLVIAQRACHTVVRLSRTPMTNLNLLNDRDDETRVCARCGEENWSAVMQTCERAMGAFPNSLHGGVDLLISPDFRRHAVLEVNAFGDLLPGATWRGMDSYQAEFAALLSVPFHVNPGEGRVSVLQESLSSTRRLEQLTP